MKKRLFEKLVYLTFYSAMCLMMLGLFLGKNGFNSVELRGNIALGLLVLAAFFKGADKIFPNWFNKDSEIKVGEKS